MEMYTFKFQPKNVSLGATLRQHHAALEYQDVENFFSNVLGNTENQDEVIVGYFIMKKYVKKEDRKTAGAKS